jgi:hypothetical protein
MKNEKHINIGISLAIRKNRKKEGNNKKILGFYMNQNFISCTRVIHESAVNCEEASSENF